MLNRLWDVFSSFQKRKVRYLVIGGTASLITADELLAHEITIFRDRVRMVLSLLFMPSIEAMVT